MTYSSSLQPDTPGALDICNAALAKIGEAPLENLIVNQSTASQLCILFYHPSRREVLSLARWTFATKEQRLTSIAGMKEQPGIRNCYSFSLPGDCLRVLNVHTHYWKLQGKTIYAWEPTIRLTYLADIENVELFDPLFMDALATKLAEKIEVPLTGSHSLRSALQQEFHKVILPQASATNLYQAYSNDETPLNQILKKHLR